MPASAEELAQLKAYLRAMVQLIEAIEARGKLPGYPTGENGAPAARLTRIP